MRLIFAIGDINETDRNEIIVGCLECAQANLVSAYENPVKYRDWRYWRGTNTLIGTYPTEGATTVQYAEDIIKHRNTKGHWATININSQKLDNSSTYGKKNQ